MPISRKFAQLTRGPTAKHFERVGHASKDQTYCDSASKRRLRRYFAGDRCARLMRIQDAAKYLSATTWQVETLLREKIIPSFVLGKRRVVDRLELDRYVERRSAMAKTEMSAAHE